VKRVFGDAYYFFALLSPRDLAHVRANDFSAGWKGEIVTTRWVLAEVADGLSTPPFRGGAIELLTHIEHNAFFRIVPTSEEQFARGFDLYRKRPDKEWSLTDCISFVVMKEEGIGEALTGDRHFEQAGFAALLA